MNTRNHKILLSFLGSALLALTACHAEVIGGGNSGSGGTGGMGTTVTTGSSNGGAGNEGGGGVAGGNPGSNAIAMLYSEIPSTDPNPTGGTTVATTTGGGGPSGDTLFIGISNMALQCNDPYAAQPCGNNWKVMLGIPPELQKVGVINLNDPGIIAHASSTGEGMDPDCAFGGGTFWDGTLEITEIDDTHVAGVLSDTMKFDFNADGPFDAERCVF